MDSLINVKTTTNNKDLIVLSALPRRYVDIVEIEACSCAGAKPVGMPVIMMASITCNFLVSID